MDSQSSRLPAWTTHVGTVFTVAGGVPLTLLLLAGVAPLLAFIDALVFAVTVTLWQHRRGVFPVVFSVLTLGLGIYTVLHRAKETNPDPDPVRPIAVHTASVEEGVAPLRVVFDAEPSRAAVAGDPLAYAWDLDGDGDFSDATEARPVRTYDRPGTYRTQVRVSEPGRPASVSHVVELVVRPAPVADAPKPKPSPERRTRQEDVTIDYAPGTVEVFELRLSVGETEVSGAEERLTRVVVRLANGSCAPWTKVRTGDRFTIDSGRLRFVVDVDEVGSFHAAQLTVTRRRVAEAVPRLRCRRQD